MPVAKLRRTLSNDEYIRWHVYLQREGHRNKVATSRR